MCWPNFHLVFNLSPLPPHRIGALHSTLGNYDGDKWDKLDNFSFPSENTKAWSFTLSLSPLELGRVCTWTFFLFILKLSVSVFLLLSFGSVVSVCAENRLIYLILPSIFIPTSLLHKLPSPCISQWFAFTDKSEPRRTLKEEKKLQLGDVKYVLVARKISWKQGFPGSDERVFSCRPQMHGLI